MEITKRDLMDDTVLMKKKCLEITSWPQESIDVCNAKANCDIPHTGHVEVNVCGHVLTEIN
jgi:hypothetical protein